VTFSDKKLLRDIVDGIGAVDRAEATVQRYPGDLDVAQVALDAVQYRVHAIGEAVSALSLEVREDHPAVPWSDIAGIRDLVGHHDDNLAIVRSTIDEPLRRLRGACQAILAEADRVGEDEP
jgi:uncharacterized protein with HEPN domain